MQYTLDLQEQFSIVLGSNKRADQSTRSIRGIKNSNEDNGMAWLEPTKLLLAIFLLGLMCGLSEITFNSVELRSTQSEFAGDDQFEDEGSHEEEILDERNRRTPSGHYGRSGRNN